MFNFDLKVVFFSIFFSFVAYNVAFCLRRAVAHCDCCLCVNTLTYFYFFTYLLKSVDNQNLTDFIKATKLSYLLPYVIVLLNSLHFTSLSFLNY